MKILVVRFSSIGDIVLTTPVLRALKEQLNNPTVHYITKQQFASIVENNPHVDRVIAMKKSIDEVIPALKEENYDHILDLHNNIRTQGLKKKLRRPSSTLRKLNWKKWLLVKIKINKMPNLHVVDRYFEVAHAIGVKSDGKPGEFYIDSNNEVDVSQLGVEPKSYLTIAIGAQYKTKCMPKELLLNILEKVDAPVVLVGGEMDNTLAEEIVNESSKNVINACGKYNLAGSASIVKQSTKLLSNDTGMMHIASCLNVPIVSVWGNTVPDLGMYPYYPNQPEKYSIHEVKDLSCRPCSKIGHQKCPKGHFKCMLEQDVDGIVKSMLL
ncbi:MAG: glycosyltransferase family 9 protein [Crocinitomicaceae bacterium]|nr:glycosyltransferase family 9 protein [Crocinitomicaceae bacterium]